MQDKQCFKCGEVKPLAAFYKHPQMADGHLNKCKECGKRDVIENRKQNLEYYREYDRKRGNRQTPEYLKSYRKSNPKKQKAHRMVSYHLRKGNIAKKPCEICGASPAHAHHDDYDHPLSVRWLCAGHHRQWHDENGEGLNA